MFTAACCLFQWRSSWKMTGYLQLPLPGEQLLVPLLELVLSLLGVQILDQLGLGRHGRRTLARPPHQTTGSLELQHKIFL